MYEQPRYENSIFFNALINCIVNPISGEIVNKNMVSLKINNAGMLLRLSA